MEDLVAQVRAASAANLYYVALLTALTLPDMCGALESEDGIASGARSADWFDRNVAPAYGGVLDGESAYKFRCSLLHQGTTQHASNKYARLLFVEPGASTNIFHNNALNDALNVDVRVFCEDMCRAVDGWLPAARALPQFERNFERFVRRHPDGLAPYIVGVPVVG